MVKTKGDMAWGRAIMGIYDRDYYRKEGRSYLDSLGMPTLICRWLLIVNIAVFILQLITRTATGEPVTEALILVPQKVLNGEVWRLLTYAFLHDTDHVTHIIFNMWFLWLFGIYLEELYGRWEFLSFYVTAAVLGGLAFMAQAALDWNLTMNTPTLGASGAVTAVMILCAFHYPRLTILLFFVLPVPIWVLAVFQVVQDSFGLLGAHARENIAFSVHLGGAAFSALYFQMHWRLLSFWPKFRSWKAQRSRPRLRVFRGDEESREPVPVAALPPAADVDEQLEAKLDAVLEKVARTGQSSLTDAEKQILLRASEIYKKRRT
jgi:membrane associated rhomboid family serine protease